MAVRRAEDESFARFALVHGDLPDALTTGFERPEQLDPEILPSLPAAVTLTPECL